MRAWNCCRTCLSSASLSPIFPQEEYSEHYTNVIFIATGVKVELNDTLPQQLCNPCITFINDTIKFRKRCELTQITLRNQINENTQEIKQEFNKTEILTLDISDYVDDDFKDYDDNITLNSLQYIVSEKIEIEDTKISNNIEYETKVQDIKETIFDKGEKEKVTKEKVTKEKDTKEKVTKVKVKKQKVKIEKSNKKTKRKEINGETEKEQIECEYCHKILTSKLSIRNHYKIHTGFDVVCEHCGKKFITRRLLLMHCRAKHGYEKTDKCSYCDYRASNAEQVKIHERLHTGEKPYVCAQCGAGFHRKSSYLQHVAIHLPEKTVQCTVCPARFKSVTLMRIHAARHRAPRYTFQCALCENNFARRRNVARHVERIHGLPPEPQTICRRKIA